MNLLILALICSSWLLSLVTGQSVAMFTLSDNTLASTTIGNIRSRVNTLPDFQNDDGYFQVMLSDFMVQSMASYFKVNRQTDLLTDKDLDRDTVCVILSCCHLTLCEVTFRAVITSVEDETPLLISIKVQLTDSNDLPPKFGRIDNIILPESTAINQEFPLPEATDGESADNSVQSYTLEESTFTFGLIMKGTRPYLKLIQKLDYERLSNYKLIYKAVDKLFTATATISVIVTDVNDNAPTFSQAIQSITVQESQDVGESLIQLTATDKDSGENGRVTYTLDIVDPTSMTSYFQVLPNSGDLQLIKGLDYENTAIAKVTQLVIVARDAGQPKESSSATVTVILEDINDNSPVVTVIALKKLREESSTPQLVAILSVRDADKQPLNALSCDLLPPRSTNFQLERQVDADGTSLLYNVFSVVPIDYETTESVQVTVECTDGFNKGLQTLSIIVEEVNEFVPTFDKPRYATSIAENTPVGSKILEVRATDGDKGKAGTILYTTTHPSNFQYFRVNNITGDVFVKNALNREDTPFISFIITATDFPGKLDQQLNSSVLVNITLVDVNDELPSYIGQTTLQVPENRPAGYRVTKLMFKDKDADNNGSIKRLFLPREVLDNNQFKVDADNFLLTDVSLDRELKSQYYLQIVAVDGGEPALSGTVTLIIDVDDVNDNAPQLLSPTANEVLQLALNSSAKTNAFVVRLLSLDNDKVDTRNSQVQYTLLPSNGSSIFRLNKTSGLVTTAWGVDSNSAMPALGIYELRVRLQDRADFNQSENLATFYVRLTAPTEDSMFALEGSINGMLILILIVTATIVISIILLWLIWRTRQAGRFHHSPINSLAGESSFKQHPDPSAIIGSNSPIEYNSFCGVEEKRYSTSLPSHSANCISACSATSRAEAIYMHQADMENSLVMDHAHSGRLNHFYHASNNISRPLAIVNGQASMEDTVKNTLRHQRTLLPMETEPGRSSVQSFADVEADSGRGGSSEDLRSHSHSYEPTARRFNTFQPRAYTTHHYHSASAVPPPVLPSAFLTLKEQAVGTAVRNDGSTFI